MKAAVMTFITIIQIAILIILVLVNIWVRSDTITNIMLTDIVLLLLQLFLIPRK